jgi:hypothetical protein
MCATKHTLCGIRATKEIEALTVTKPDYRSYRTPAVNLGVQLSVSRDEEYPSTALALRQIAVWGWEIQTL